MQGDAFPPIYSRMVRVAEASGTLETVLERIAHGREKAQKLKSMALSEVLYPCLLIVMAIVRRHRYADVRRPALQRHDL